MRRKNNEHLKIYLLIIIYAVLSVVLFDPKLHTGGDNVRYLILTESLSRFKGFLDLHLPGTPPHTQYPFGFPLLLVPLFWIFGKNVVILKLVPFFCGIGALWFFIQLMRRLLVKEWLYPALAFIFTPILIEYNHWLFSEMPFLFFSLGSLYFLTRYRERALFFILGSLFAVYAYFIRTAGITLILGIAVSLLYRRDWKKLLLFAVIFLVPFGLWQYRNSRIPQEWSYFQQLVAKDPYNREAGIINFYDFITRIRENLSLYLFNIVGSAFFPVISMQFVQGLIGLIFLVCFIAGFIIRRRILDFIDFYIVFALALLLAWPRVWSGDRFLLPIMPILLFYLSFSLARLFDQLKLRFGLQAVIALFILINLFKIIPSLGAGFSSKYPIDYQRYFEVCKWVRENTPTGSSIVARKPEFVYFFSNRKSFLYTFSYDEDRVLKDILNADYVLLDNFMWTATTQKYLLPVVRRNVALFTVEYQTPPPEFYLLRVLR